MNRSKSKSKIVWGKIICKGGEEIKEDFKILRESLFVKNMTEDGDEKEPMAIDFEEDTIKLVIKYLTHV
jgi:hypothetical protein